MRSAFFPLHYSEQRHAAHDNHPQWPPVPFSFSSRVLLVEPLTIVGASTVLSLARLMFAPFPPVAPLKPLPPAPPAAVAVTRHIPWAAACTVGVHCGCTAVTRTIAGPATWAA